MRWFTSVLLTGLALLAGCASGPEKIGAAYISPLQYESYDRQQIAAELDRVNCRISELEGRLKKRADDDAAKVAWGVGVFWPVLLFVQGDGPDAQEYARLKGERDALERVAIQKSGLSGSAPR